MDLLIIQVVIPGRNDLKRRLLFNTGREKEKKVCNGHL